MGWQRPEVFSLRSAPTIRVKEQRLSRRGMTRTICVCLSFCRKADSERRWSSVWIVTYPEYGHSDRKSTRLNSSHLVISYAVFCLKKKKCIEVVVGLSEYVG